MLFFAINWITAVVIYFLEPFLTLKSLTDFDSESQTVDVTQIEITIVNGDFKKKKISYCWVKN